MSQRKFPEMMYVAAHDAFDEEGPFVCCTPDKESSVDACEDGERVAVYRLVKVGRAAKKFDLAFTKP